jgi:hypothetical protein
MSFNHGTQTMSKRPMIEITFVETKAGKTKVRGRMSRPPKWIREGAVYVPPDSVIGVRIARYGRKCRMATLYLEEGQSAAPLKTGSRYTFLRMSEAWRARIVLSDEFTWQKKVFVVRHGVRLKRDGECHVRLLEEGEDRDHLPEGGEYVENADDHEHCFICGQCICPVHEPAGFVASDGGWSCEKCYTSYILPRNVNFPYWEF